MKVISGKYKGRKIIGFDLEGTRPTMDRVKESLFAMIQQDLVDACILDLFSGSGNLGIEALSQGAKYAYLIDNNSKAISIIEKNMKLIGIDNYSIYKENYIKALNHFNDKNIKFDIIFLDPPYNTDYIKKSIDLITSLSLLANNGLIVCESDDLNKINYPDTYEKIKEKKYGDKWVVIIKKI